MNISQASNGAYHEAQFTLKSKRENSPKPNKATLTQAK